MHVATYVHIYNVYIYTHYCDHISGTDQLINSYFWACENGGWSIRSHDIHSHIVVATIFIDISTLAQYMLTYVSLYLGTYVHTCQTVF